MAEYTHLTEYAHPEVLVSTTWLAANLQNPKVRIVESDEDILLYEVGHIPGAVKLDWFTTLQDPLRRDFVNKAQFETICRQNGITNDMLVVFYGDKSNWFACYTLWLFQYYGHQAVAILDGGRTKWDDEGHEWVQSVPIYPHTQYKAKAPNRKLRALRDDVMRHLKQNGALVDVRSPKEYSGELLHMPSYPQEGATRGGHIPGAKNIPWALATRSDGTFKPVAELEALYREHDITPDREVVAYCRIGERSSHTWFVLKHLLGYPNVRNYDGSWTEWGNLVNAPIER
jgi:thiosulfate/3-mercaptopyruvate sulfurtransferase